MKMTVEEIKQAIRDGEARNRKDAHGLAYAPPIRFTDGATRCNCGWQSKRTTPGRAMSAWKQHRAAANMRARKERERSDTR